MPPNTEPAEKEIKLPTLEEIASDIATLNKLREKYLGTKRPHGFTAAGALHTGISTLEHFAAALKKAVAEKTADTTAPKN